MPNRWGNFCSPEDDALSKGAYPPLHCYTMGEIIGLLFAVESGLVSTIALLVAFLIIFRNARRQSRLRTGKRLIQQPMDVFLLSLFISEFLLSVGTTLSIKWIHDGKVQIGTYCQAQGVLVGLPPAVMGWTTLIIAIYTFVRVWWQKGKGKRALAISWVIVGLIWTYETLFVSLSASRFHGNNFYHPTPYWCWIGKYFIAQKLGGEYMWLWSAMIFSFLLYTPLFFLARGNVTPDPGAWWKFKIHPISERTVHLSLDRKRSLYMIAYPLVYAFTVIPNTVVRWVGFGQENSGNHINHVPAAASFVARSIFGLSGIANVVLFIVTRPNLPLLGFKDDHPIDAGQTDEPSGANNGDYESHPRDTADGNHAGGSGRGSSRLAEMKEVVGTDDTPNVDEAEMKKLANAFGWHLNYDSSQT